MENDAQVEATRDDYHVVVESTYREKPMRPLRRAKVEQQLVMTIRELDRKKLIKEVLE